jgi:threonine/homoserine/homoserine lactone efflux protein
MAKKSTSSPVLKRKLYSLLALILVIACLLLVNIALVVFAIVFDKLMKSLGVRWWRDLVGTLTILIFGIALYRLREKRRMYYAVFEISFALVSTWISINNIEDRPNMTTWIALAGAVYLIIRGIDNYNKAKDEIENPATFVSNPFTLLGISKSKKKCDL